MSQPSSPRRPCRLARRGPRAVVEPVELRRVGQVQGEVVRVGEQVLLERRRERGEPFVQRTEPGAVGGIERRARQHGLAVHPLEQVRLVGIEPELVAHPVEHADPREEAGVEADGVAVRGEPRRELRLEGVDRLVRVGGARIREHRQHAAEERARALERHERVLERGRRRILRDRLDLGALLAHAGLDRLAVVLGSHEGEQRQPVGERTGFEERIRRVAHPTTLGRAGRMPRRS